MTDEVFCQWVNARVERSALANSCHQFITDGINCKRCEKSPQLEMGMSPKELLRNIKDQ